MLYENITFLDIYYVSILNILLMISSSSQKLFFLLIKHKHYKYNLISTNIKYLNENKNKEHKNISKGLMD